MFSASKELTGQKTWALGPSLALQRIQERAAPGVTRDEVGQGHRPDEAQLCMPSQKVQVQLEIGDYKECKGEAIVEVIILVKKLLQKQLQ